MIPMRLTIIGCAGSYPGPESATSCYLVEADEPDGRTWRILLDLGSGALGALQRFADPFGIDAVFISHLHADHCLDLCGYHVLRRYHPDGAQPRIPVWGPVGTAQRMAQAYGLPEAIGMNDEFAFYEDHRQARRPASRGDRLSDRPAAQHNHVIATAVGAGSA